MADLAISVRGVSKKYRLGQVQPYKTIRESLSNAFGQRKASGNKEDRETEEIWALKDVSFDVNEGEVIGVIGPNGAGKTTLLKILSRITEPTEGEVELFGRVSSLLEVGTGFHPELTGRENIYLNASVLGMRKKEIDQKFNEIVEFSGVERFLDTPVKRYSSGMQVRLAFSVAAHLEPEILLVDEVLAVGDAEFQRKCLAKMDDVSRGGRTVLFVSHNMAAVESLCERCLLMRSGKLEASGSREEILALYRRLISKKLHGNEISQMDIGRKDTFLRELAVCGADGVKCIELAAGQAVNIVMELKSRRPLYGIRVYVSFYDLHHTTVATLGSDYQYVARLDLNGTLRLNCEISSLRLAPGSYSLGYSIWHDDKVIEIQQNYLNIQVFQSDLFGVGKQIPKWSGVYIPDVVWRHSY